MKKLILNAFFLLATVAGWSFSVKGTHKIECAIEKIDTNTDHRKGVSPFKHVRQSTSSNWSGYVSAPNLNHEVLDTVKEVSGTWVVPTLTSTPDLSYCSLWVGIDGFLNGTVEQIGTAHYWMNGSQHNYAWFEMYPRGPHVIHNFPLDRGDQISAQVDFVGNDTFELTMVNHTKGVHTIIPTRFTVSAAAHRSSAEWVVEAPATSNQILPLADFGFALFRGCKTMINGVTGTISNPHWLSDAINMEANGVVKALTSHLNNNGQRFNVTWEHE